jgi:hypothetical protein
VFAHAAVENDQLVVHLGSIARRRIAETLAG